MTRVLVALVVAVVVGAVAAPSVPTGVGWLICALAGLGVAITARTVRGQLTVPHRLGSPWVAPRPPLGQPALVAPVVSTPAAPGTAPGFTAAAPAAPVPTPAASAAPAATPTVTTPVTPTPVAPIPAAPQAAPASVMAPAPLTPPPPVMVPAPLAPPPAGLTARQAASAWPPPEPPRATQTAADRAWRNAAGVASLLLVAVPAVRASEVLAVFCLLAALALGSYALVGGRSWSRVAGGAFSLVPGSLQALGWLARWRPAQAPDQGKQRSSSLAPWRVLMAILISITLAAILIPLLRSADPVFADLLDSWLDYLPSLDGRSFLGAMLLAYLGLGAAFFAHRGTLGNRTAGPGNHPLGGLDWMIPVVVVDVIFAIFVGVQATVLFAGHEYVLKAGGPDYAEYARGGFGELCAVTVLSLGIVAGLGGLAQRETLRQRVMIRTAGGLLCALTLVIVASALRRMLLYVDAYGFTWLRLLSFSFEIWLGVVLLLVMAAGTGLRGAWLPRATFAAATAVLFALVAVNPEAVMARTHVDARHDGRYPVDVYYLDDLSADALDEILLLPPAERDCVLHRLARDLSEPDPWYEFNVARERARDYLATADIGTCRTG